MSEGNNFYVDFDPFFFPSFRRDLGEVIIYVGSPLSSFAQFQVDLHVIHFFSNGSLLHYKAT